MKQHITKEQWEERTDEQKFLFMQEVKENENILPTNLPNIGQMIEFLGDEWINELFDAGCGRYCSDDGEWQADNQGLCDDLWKATKHKLENK